LLSHDWCFFPGTPDYSTTKTDCHDIAEILLKVALKHQKSNQSIGGVMVRVVTSYYDENKLFLNDDHDEVRFVLDQHT
jgi:hypothetical protein